MTWRLLRRTLCVLAGLLVPLTVATSASAMASVDPTGPATAVTITANPATSVSLSWVRATGGTLTAQRVVLVGLVGGVWKDLIVPMLLGPGVSNTTNSQSASNYPSIPYATSYGLAVESTGGTLWNRSAVVAWVPGSSWVIAAAATPSATTTTSTPTTSTTTTSSPTSTATASATSTASPTSSSTSSSSPSPSSSAVPSGTSSSTAAASPSGCGSVGTPCVVELSTPMWAVVLAGIALIVLLLAATLVSSWGR